MKTIKLISVGLFMATFSLISCQKESLRITDEQQEESLVDDAQLLGLVRGVTAHDGSHDNIVDSSDCFSINFPYSCNVNGEVFLYQQASDLNDLYETDDIQPVFPITLTYANYIEVTVSNQEEFQELITRCSSGLLYNDAIACVDFIYPISLSMYNADTLDFSTVTLDHDRMTFTELAAMTAKDVASINYPIFIQVLEGELFQINSNQELKAVIQENLSFCF